MVVKLVIDNNEFTLFMLVVPFNFVVLLDKLLQLGDEILIFSNKNLIEKFAII